MIIVYMLIHQELTLLLITFNNLGIDVILLNRLVMSLRYL